MKLMKNVKEDLTDHGQNIAFGQRVDCLTRCYSAFHDMVRFLDC